ncbi:MAG: hypothetical protein WCC06_09590 [Candidatus Aminicenantales bacterium]
MGNMLLGSCTAKLDKSGRIKIPEKFRTAIEEQYGKMLFITSLEDESVQLFPLPVWEEMTGITNKGTLHLDPTVREFLRRVNRKGAYAEIDSKGRILISQPLREKANFQCEVEVIGLTNHLEIWDKSILDEKLENKPLTHEDFKNIAKLMSNGKLE